ncbi:MAG: SUMF1/EgtB/PvdO family nonheme iron enzyme, partial [Planctomycetes bacterium]|nr:SUMF1/EgtB/PvdO family nonheme iron enzyme [Planctomycetota bacterium]
TTTRYSFGDSESALAEYAWYDANSGNTTHPFGQKKPNWWWLYDMHVNVREWCEDWYHASYNGAPMDGSAWISDKGDVRVVRGGSWYFLAGTLRAADRGGGTPGGRDGSSGFRVSASFSPR